MHNYPSFFFFLVWGEPLARLTFFLRNCSCSSFTDDKPKYEIIVTTLIHTINFILKGNVYILEDKYIDMNK